MPTTRSIILDIEERKRGNALLGAANDMDKLAAEVEKTDHKFALFTKDMERVNAEITKSSTRVKDLRTQIARTNDQSLFGDLRKEEANLKRFENLAKTLTRDAEAAGVIGGQAFLGGFGEALKAPQGLGGGEGAAAIGGVVGGLATAVAPPLGAAVAGSIVGLVGTGGIIGGVLAASHDQRVKDAFGHLAKTAEGEFFGAGKSFIDPTLRSIGILEKATKDLDLSKTFGLAAGDLEPIVKGLASFATNVMPGLDKLLERSGPFAQEAAIGFARLGTATSEFLDNISKSQGAVQGIDVIFGTLSNTIRFAGVSLEGLSMAFNAFNTVGANVFVGLDHGLGLIGLHEGHLHALAQELDRVVGLTDQPATSALGAFSGAVTNIGTASALTDKMIAALNADMEQTRQTVEDFISSSLGVDEAQTAVRKGFVELEQTLQDNGAAWGVNTDAAFNNEEAVQRQIEALDRLRQAEIKSGAVTQSVADQEFERNIQQLIAMAKAAGISTDALDALAKQYIIEVDIRSNLAAIGEAIGASFKGLENGGGLAAGGPALPGMSYTVGESGMERLDVLPGGGALVTPLGPRSGGQAVNVTIVLPGGGDLGSAVVAHLAKHAQVYGGGNVQLAITGRLN